MNETQEYELRTYGDGFYGVGLKVTSNVFYFEADNYGLTKEEAEKKLKQLRGKR